MNLDPFAHVQHNVDYILGGTGTALANRHRHHRQTREQHESAEELDFRKTVLRNFKCSFEKNEVCRFSANPDQCLFAHVNGSSTGSDAVQPDLKKVPPYVCIYHLVNSCHFDSHTTSGPTAQNQPNSSNPSNSSFRNPIPNSYPKPTKRKVQ